MVLNEVKTRGFQNDSDGEPSAWEIKRVDWDWRYMMEEKNHPDEIIHAMPKLGCVILSVPQSECKL